MIKIKTNPIAIPMSIHTTIPVPNGRSLSIFI